MNFENFIHYTVKKWSNIILLIILLQNSQAISQSTQSVSKKADTASTYQSVHFHFDKDIYIPGETIWFKAYLHNAGELSLSATNFYAAIYNEDGSLIQQKLYPIFGGICIGDFKIPDSLKSKRIVFRAFTKAMILGNRNNVYQKIFNTRYTSNKGIDKNANIEFYPEGGQIISRLENFIVVKTTLPNGQPINIAGKIIEVESNKVVTTFCTNKYGLGNFTLVPLPRKTYAAIYDTGKYFIKQALLPLQNLSGVTLHAEQRNNKLLFDITKNKKNDSLNTLHLSARIYNYQIYSADLSIPNEMEIYTIELPMDSLPKGIIEFTLFDKYMNVLQCRPVFIDGEKIETDVLVIPEVINTAPNAKNTIEIILRDSIFSNLSVSIADYHFYEENKTPSIQQDFLFASQMEDLNVNIDTLLVIKDRKNIDLVVLAYRLKKYPKNKLLLKRDVDSTITDNYLSIAANFNGKNTISYVDDILNLIMQNKTESTQFYNLQQTNLHGFKKSGFIFFDSIKLFYQLNKNKKLTNRLSIFSDDTLKLPLKITPLENEPQYKLMQASEVDDDILHSFNNPVKKSFNDTLTITEVVVQSRYSNRRNLRINELDKKYTSGMFSGTVKGYQLNVLDDTLGVSTANNLKDYIRFRVPGLELHRNIFGKMQNQSNGDLKTVVPVFTPTLVFVNEVQTDPILDNSLDFIDVASVAYIKYIPGIVIGGGFVSTTGAIYIYTKKGNEKISSGNGMPYVFISGYNSKNEFTIPDYNSQNVDALMDLRSTLYWNPEVILDKTNNKFRIDFYNNSISKKFKLKIEGLNAYGKLIHIEKIIE